MACPGRRALSARQLALNITTEAKFPPPFAACKDGRAHAAMYIAANEAEGARHCRAARCDLARGRQPRTSPALPKATASAVDVDPRTTPLWVRPATSSARPKPASPTPLSPTELLRSPMSPCEFRLLQKRNSKHAWNDCNAYEQLPRTTTPARSSKFSSSRLRPSLTFGAPPDISLHIPRIINP